MSENKSLKDKTFLKLFARYRGVDIHIKFCAGNSSSVTIGLQTGSGMAK
jgi:hypothetical protein